MGLILRLLSNSNIKKRYAEAGRIFGDAFIYFHNEKCENFEKFLNEWEKFEGEYARRGFRTLSLGGICRFRWLWSIDRTSFWKKKRNWENAYFICDYL